MLIRIEAPWFVAGVVVEGGRVVRAADIVGYMIDWPASRVFEYAKKRRWQCT